MSFGMRPSSVRKARQMLEQKQQQPQHVQNDGLFAGIIIPDFTPIQASELEVTMPNILQFISRKLGVLTQNIQSIQTTVEQISKIQASNLKLEQQIENIFYSYLDQNINPNMLRIDQKIAGLLDKMEHPKGKDYSTIDMAEKVAEIEQQVYSDSMSLLHEDVQQIKKMLMKIQQKQKQE